MECYALDRRDFMASTTPGHGSGYEEQHPNKANVIMKVLILDEQHADRSDRIWLTM